MPDTSVKGKIIRLRQGITAHTEIKMDLFTHTHMRALASYIVFTHMHIHSAYTLPHKT